MAIGTHGDTYLGIGCKESHLIKFRDKDFQSGLAQMIVLSETRVSDGRINIGASLDSDNSYYYSYQIITDNLPKRPLYIHFEPGSKYDYWDLDEIRVTVDAGSEHIVFSALGEKSYLWSGGRGPKVMYLGEQLTETH